MSDTDDISSLETVAPGLIVRAAARRDIAGTFRYLAENSPDRARRFAAAVEATARQLVTMPHLGSLRGDPDPRLHDLRQWPVKDFKSYLIFYRPFASSNGIEVFRVLHVSRDATVHLRDNLTHED